MKIRVGWYGLKIISPFFSHLWALHNLDKPLASDNKTWNYNEISLSNQRFHFFVFSIEYHSMSYNTHKTKCFFSPYIFPSGILELLHTSVANLATLSLYLASIQTPLATHFQINQLATNLATFSGVIGDWSESTYLFYSSQRAAGAEMNHACGKPLIWLIPHLHSGRDVNLKCLSKIIHCTKINHCIWLTHPQSLTHLGSLWHKLNI
jgi:hypothetical protein